MVSTTSFDATTSIWPVAMSGLTMLSGLARTVPSIATQYSLLSSLATDLRDSGASASTTTWVVP